MKYMIVIFFLSLVFSVNAQTKYDPYDSAAIMENREWEKRARKKSDRELAYDVGFFFERIYKKYKDTSMNAAIRNYKVSAYAEGPLDQTASFVAAKRLADIYSQGIGTRRDLDRALIYYYISWFEGADSLEALRKRMAGNDYVGFGNGQSDSIVINFHPLLRIESEGTKKVMKDVEKRLQDNPEWVYKLDVILPDEQTTAIYNYYMRQDLPRKLDQNVFELMESVSWERKLFNGYNYREDGKPPRAKLILVILKQRPEDR